MKFVGGVLGELAYYIVQVLIFTGMGLVLILKPDIVLKTISKDNKVVRWIIRVVGILVALANVVLNLSHIFKV